MADEAEITDIPEGFTKEDVILARELIEEDKSKGESEQQEQSSETPAPPEEAPPKEEAKAKPEEGALVFNIKGEEVEYTKDKLQHLLAREKTFQQKYEEIRKSDTTKLGVLMAAAKGGDAGAQKQVFDQLKSMTDNDVYELEDVEEEFDVDKKMEESRETDAEDEIFSDVKGDVDFDTTLDKMKEHFPTRMPAKLFQSYWDNPEERRVMYDLAKSGRADEIFDALDGELNQLPLADRIKLKQDPDAYAMAVVEVINGLNAPQSSSQPKDLGQTELDAVSTGTSSHRQEKEESLPDVSKMTDQQFKDYQIKHFGKVL